MKKIAFISSFFFAVPMLVSAQQYFGQVTSLLGQFLNIINVYLIPIVLALALLYFFWGLAKFILSAGDEEERKKGKSIMIWGIVAFFVMIAVWGIVNFLVNAFGFQGQNRPNTIPGVGGNPFF